MSENKTTFEEKLLAYALLGFSFLFGYWTRSDLGITMFIEASNFIWLDGLIRIGFFGLGVLVMVGLILIRFDNRKDEQCRNAHNVV